MNGRKVEAASRFPSELGVRGTMRFPNRKEELAQAKCTLIRQDHASRGSPYKTNRRQLLCEMSRIDQTIFLRRATFCLNFAEEKREIVRRDLLPPRATTAGVFFRMYKKEQTRFHKSR
jgi:hypothetical protein